MEEINFCGRCHKKLRNLYIFKYGFNKKIEINFHKICFYKTLSNKISYEELLEIIND